MKILLVAVNAKYIHSNLAVYSLKASSGRYEPFVTLAEYTINHQTDDIFQAIYRQKPDLLFFSCYIWNRQVILETAENIRKVLPDTIIWAGGPEVSYDAREFLTEYPAFDGVMVGEGEQTFHALLQYYVDGIGALKDIQGLVYRAKACRQCDRDTDPMEGSRQCDRDTDPTEDSRQYDRDTCTGAECGEADLLLYETGLVQPVRALDDLPFVYGNLQEFENRIIYYESSRGCPFSCSYCLSSIDRRVRFRSPELVKKELGFFLENRVPQVKFVDRTFNCSHAHAMEIWRYIRDNDNGVTNFHFEIAADLLDDEELELLAGMRPGLVQLEIGVQTVNEQALGGIHRTARFEKIVDRVNRIASHGNIHQHLDLIAGLPYEDFESFRTSFDAVYRLHPQELQLGFLKLLKGSEMHRRAGEYGIICRSLPPYEVLETRWISCDELLRLKEVEEMLEVYYNSQQFRYTMTALEQLFDRPFDLYAALADYYKENALTGKAWSRMQRFVHLQGFVRTVLKPEQTDRISSHAFSGRMKNARNAVGTQLRKFDELLTLDLYLRENAKSRPEWAEDQTCCKEQIMQFYRKEEETHTYLPAFRGMTWKQMMRMTHLEHFTYDVTGSGEPGENWILFNYESRNPLTYDAAVIQAEM